MPNDSRDDGRRVLYVARDGVKHYVNGSGGFSRDKRNARIFKTEHDWQIVMRALVKEKAYPNIEPVNFIPTYDDDELQG